MMQFRNRVNVMLAHAAAALGLRSTASAVSDSHQKLLDSEADKRRLIAVTMGRKAVVPDNGRRYTHVPVKPLTKRQRRKADKQARRDAKEARQ